MPKNRWVYADSLMVSETGQVNVAVSVDDIGALRWFLCGWQIEPSIVDNAATGVVDVAFPANVDAEQARTIMHRFDELNTPR